MRVDFSSNSVRVYRSLLTASVLLLSLVSCRPSTETVVAEVEGRRLTLRDLVPERGADSASLTKAVLMDRMLRWVDREALYREAMRRKIDKDPRVVELLQDAQRKILVDQLRMRLRDSVTEPTESVLADYHRQHPQEFLRERPSYRIVYLTDRTPKEINAVRELVKGMGVAKVRSQLDSAGILQPASPSGLVESDSCFGTDLPSTPVGLPTQVRSCFGGLAIAVVTERFDSGTVKPLAEVLPELKEKVREASLASKLAEVLVEAKSRVVISTDLSPFQQYPDSLEKK